MFQRKGKRRGNDVNIDKGRRTKAEALYSSHPLQPDGSDKATDPLYFPDPQLSHGAAESCVTLYFPAAHSVIVLPEPV